MIPSNRNINPTEAVGWPVNNGLIVFLPGNHEFNAGGGIGLGSNHACVIEGHVFAEEPAD